MRIMRAVLTALCLSSLCAWTADRLTAELLAAAQTGHTEQVESLIAAGAKVNAKGKEGMTPLLAATTKNHARTVKALIDRGAHADAKGGRDATPLFIAAREGYDSVVLVLLAAGADVNARDRDGWTPLLRAARGEPCRHCPDPDRPR